MILLPLKPFRPCSYPGCPELIRGGGRCEKHKKQSRQEQDRQRGNFRERGYTSQWDKVRALQLARAPLCAMCMQHDRVEPATVVHHIKPITEGGAMLDMDNLMSLCRQCHEATHGRAKDPRNVGL